MYHLWKGGVNLMKSDKIIEAVIAEGEKEGAIPENTAIDKLNDMVEALNNRIDAKFSTLENQIKNITEKENMNHEQSNINGQINSRSGESRNEGTANSEVPVGGGQDQQE